MSKNIFYLLNSIVCLFVFVSCTAHENKIDKTENVSKKEIQESKEYEWLNQEDSDYQVKDVKAVTGISRTFEVVYKKSTYTVLFETEGEMSNVTISLNGQKIGQEKITMLTTLHVGAVRVNGKQELWIETAENRPIHYKVELGESKCTISKVQEDHKAPF